MWHHKKLYPHDSKLQNEEEETDFALKYTKHRKRPVLRRETNYRMIPYFHCSTFSCSSSNESESEEINSVTEEYMPIKDLIARNASLVNHVEKWKDIIVFPNQHVISEECVQPHIVI